MSEPGPQPRLSYASIASKRVFWNAEASPAFSKPFISEARYAVTLTVPAGVANGTTLMNLFGSQVTKRFPNAGIKAIIDRSDKKTTKLEITARTANDLAEIMTIEVPVKGRNICPVRAFHESEAPMEVQVSGISPDLGSEEVEKEIREQFAQVSGELISVVVEHPTFSTMVHLGRAVIVIVATEETYKTMPTTFRLSRGAPVVPKYRGARPCCFYCREEGHWVSMCPNSKRTRRANQPRTHPGHPESKPRAEPAPWRSRTEPRQQPQVTAKVVAVEQPATTKEPSTEPARGTVQQEENPWILSRGTRKSSKRPRWPETPQTPQTAPRSGETVNEAALARPKAEETTGGAALATPSAETTAVTRMSVDREVTIPVNRRPAVPSVDATMEPIVLEEGEITIPANPRPKGQNPVTTDPRWLEEGEVLALIQKRLEELKAKAIEEGWWAAEATIPTNGRNPGTPCPNAKGAGDTARPLMEIEEV